MIVKKFCLGLIITKLYVLTEKEISLSRYFYYSKYIKNLIILSPFQTGDKPTLYSILSGKSSHGLLSVQC